MLVVNPSIFPAPLPIAPIPGAIKAIIMSGIAKLRKFPNNPLNVAKIFMIESGEKLPTNIPKPIAKIIRGSKPIFFMMRPPELYNCI